MVGLGNYADHADLVGAVFAGDVDRAPTCPPTQTASATSGLVSQAAADLQRCLGIGQMANLAAGVFSNGRFSDRQHETAVGYSKSAAFRPLLLALRAVIG